MLQLQGPKNNFWLLTADNAGALTVVLMKKFRKTQKNEQVFGNFFFQSRVEKKIFHPRLFRIFLKL